MKRKYFTILIIIIFLVIVSVSVGYEIFPENNKNIDNNENEISLSQKKKKNYTKLYDYLKEKQYVQEKNFNLQYHFYKPFENSDKYGVFEENIEKADNNFSMIAKTQPRIRENGENKILNNVLKGKAVIGKNAYYLYHIKYLDNNSSDNQVKENENLLTGKKWKLIHSGSETPKGRVLLDTIRRNIRDQAEKNITYILIFLPKYEILKDSTKVENVLTLEEKKLKINYKKVPIWMEAENRNIVDASLNLQVHFNDKNKIKEIHGKGVQKESIDNRIYKTKIKFSLKILNNNQIQLRIL